MPAAAAPPVTAEPPAVAAPRPAFPEASLVAGAQRTLDIGNGVSLDLVWIPAGEFMMGSRFGEEGRVTTEGLRHRVTLSHGFWMGKYPVTQAQWEQVMGGNPSAAKGPRLPVNQVNWTDCQAFVEALNRRIASVRLLAALPTEAQWEYACRAGTSTRFYSGDRDEDLAGAGWFLRNSDNKPHEVGQKLQNNWGLYDMHGNVWRWCQDRLAPYPREPAVDPSGPDSGDDRVMRGGAWNGEADICRAAYRFSYPPSYRIMTAGLRIVVVP